LDYLEKPITNKTAKKGNTLLKNINTTVIKDLS